MKITTVGITLLGAVLVVSLHAGCDGGAAQDDANQTTGGGQQKSDAEVAVVKIGDFHETIDVVATIQAYEQTQLMARVDGYVASVNVDIGDEVQKGDVLIQLDVPELLAEVERTDALVTKVTADLKTQRAEVELAQTQLTEQQALHRLSQTVLDRMSKLVAQGGLGEEKRDEATFKLASAEAAVARCHANISAAKAQGASVVAALAVAEAELRKAEAMAGYLKIKAPFDGVITERMVDSGDFVRPGTVGSGTTALLDLARVDRLRVISFVTMEEAGKIDTGDQVVLHNIQGMPGVTLGNSADEPLMISRYAPAFDRQSRRMRVEIDVENSREIVLKPNSIGIATITLDSSPDVLTVPVSAVGRDQESDKSYVILVAEKNEYTKRFVGRRIARKDEMDLASYRLDERDPTLKNGDRVVKDLAGFKDVPRTAQGSGNETISK